MSYLSSPASGLKALMLPEPRGRAANSFDQVSPSKRVLRHKGIMGGVCPHCGGHMTGSSLIHRLLCLRGMGGAKLGKWKKFGILLYVDSLLLYFSKNKNLEGKGMGGIDFFCRNCFTFPLNLNNDECCY